MSPDDSIPESPSASIELAPGVFVPSWAIRVSYARSGGPGGQNVNKVNSKAEVWLSLSGLHSFAPGVIERAKKIAGRKLTADNEIHVSCEAGRSQPQNRQEAFARLGEIIVAAMHVPKVRRKTKISYGAQQRRLQSKKKRSEIKSGRSARGHEHE